MAWRRVWSGSFSMSVSRLVVKWLVSCLMLFPLSVVWSIGGPPVLLCSGGPSLTCGAGFLVCGVGFGQDSTVLAWWCMVRICVNAWCERWLWRCSRVVGRGFGGRWWARGWRSVLYRSFLRLCYLSREYKIFCISGVGWTALSEWPRRLVATPPRRRTPRQWTPRLRLKPFFIAPSVSVRSPY